MPQYRKAAKTIGAAALTLLLALTAGCSDTSWGAEWDGQRMPAGVYINEVLTAYSTGLGKLDDTEQTNVWKNTIEGQDAASWMRAQAQDNVYSYFATEKKFEEMGLTLDELTQAQIEYAVEAQWAYYQATYEENGISRDSFRKAIENTYKRSSVFDAIYGKEGSEPVPQEDLLAKFNQEYINMDRIYFSIVGEGGDGSLPQEEIDKLTEKAKGYQERIEKGESIQEIAEEYQKEQQTDDSAVASTGSTSLTIPREDSGYSQTFMENISSAAPGKPIVFEDDANICLVIVNEVTAESPIFLQNEDYLLSDMKSEEFEQRLAQWGRELNIVFNDAAVSRYDVKKLKITKNQ